jgi:hypothetical protein
MMFLTGFAIGMVVGAGLAWRLLTSTIIFSKKLGK